jgi:(1->4)-alpha-D-glucan 1-alpha-D-glucosylmutase
MTPRATYRIQFHRDFPFARAEEIVPYLARLGISHIYASPITTARSGSLHGYDVVDPTRVNPELGGEVGLRSLVAALHEQRMGLVIDIVPNHMGIAGGENAWWNDVLRHGEASAYAKFFDVDWREKLLLPILGAPLEQVLAEGHIALEAGPKGSELVVYGEHRLPVRLDQGDTQDAGDLRALLHRQPYRLGWWRAANDELNWRRFFAINELAGLRVEDPEVFETTHELVFRLYGEGLIDGVRIDHIDGLTDPAGYCRALRQRLEAIRPSDRAWIVVEKILGPGEQLARDWHTDGTSGYDFMEEVAALLHDPAGEAPLGSLWEELSGRPADFAKEELQARQDMLRWSFEGQLAGCAEAFHALARSDAETCGLTRGMLRRSIERLLWVFPVYRTYGTGTAAPTQDKTVREQARERARRFTPPGESEVVDYILGWLSGEGPGDRLLVEEAVRRFQQLSAPIAAKAVEDTAFYRHGKLLSRTDVGFDPACFALSPDAFHRACKDRAKAFPGGLLATATHDHKRGEDVRARLAVISSVPDLWRERVERWDELVTREFDEVHPADRYALYQTVFGAWPDGLQPDDAEGLRRYAERVAAWQEKALREAKLRSSWEAPEAGYETLCRRMGESMLRPHSPLARDLHELVAETAGAVLSNMLVQAALKFTVPGVPDIYQGTELADFSLVDPDNRRPVDFVLREQALDRGEHPKISLVADLLGLRRRHPSLFRDGTYNPVAISGLRSGRVLAFERRADGMRLLCAMALRCGSALLGRAIPHPEPDWWGDTVIGFKDAARLARDCFAGSPVFVHVVNETGG